MKTLPTLPLHNKTNKFIKLLYELHFTDYQENIEKMKDSCLTALVDCTVVVIK